MAYDGITMGGFHSYKDFDLTIESKTIGNPSKKKTLINLPFSNVQYDMSEIYGGQVYEQRELEYTFNVYDKMRHSKEAMNVMKIRALNNLMKINSQVPLYDDVIPGYHFLAEIRGGPSFTEKRGKGLLTVKFDAYSFKIANEAEGGDVWDTFNFILDIAQLTFFTINGQRHITLINEGIGLANPIIKSSSTMVINVAGIRYTINPGETKSLDFNLINGINQMSVIGNGTIEFIWYKEVI